MEIKKDMEEIRPLDYTTLEESKLLVNLGFNPDTADKHYYFIEQIDGSYKEEICHKPIKELQATINGKEIIPCWSLAVLLELIPKIIWYHKVYKELQIRYDDDHYVVYYISGFNSTNDCTSKFLIEAVIKMITWLINNNIKTKKDD